MNEVTTLVVGNTGTGKELVARAVGLSQYVPFDKNKRQFTDAESERFFPLNLSAFSPTLIESELFGHEKGSFTGAIASRAGWLESAGRYGTVFLDEIGELDVSIQVKLLRVLQQRQFQRIGDSKTLEFKGKFVSAFLNHAKGCRGTHCPKCNKDWGHLSSKSRSNHYNKKELEAHQEWEEEQKKRG